MRQGLSGLYRKPTLRLRDQPGKADMLKLNRLMFLSFFLVLMYPHSAFSQYEQQTKKKQMPKGTPVLWREPADIETRNLLLGAGGEAMKPKVSKITFIEQKEGGYSTKYRVRDASGNEW